MILLSPGYLQALLCPWSCATERCPCHPSTSPTPCPPPSLLYRILHFLSLSKPRACYHPLLCLGQVTAITLRGLHIAFHLTIASSGLATSWSSSKSGGTSLLWKVSRPKPSAILGTSLRSFLRDETQWRMIFWSGWNFNKQFFVTSLAQDSEHYLY